MSRPGDRQTIRLLSEGAQNEGQTLRCPFQSLLQHEAPIYWLCHWVLPVHHTSSIRHYGVCRINDADSECTNNASWLCWCFQRYTTQHLLTKMACGMVLEVLFGRHRGLPEILKTILIFSDCALLVLPPPTEAELAQGTSRAMYNVRSIARYVLIIVLYCQLLTYRERM